MFFLNLVANIFSLISRFVFLLHLSFPCCAKAFTVNEVPFVQFCFLFRFSKCGSEKNLFRFFQMVFSIVSLRRLESSSLSQLFNWFAVSFLYWVRGCHHFIHFSPVKEPPSPALHPDCSQFTRQHQCRRDPFSSQPLHSSLFVDFQTKTILTV